MLQGRSNLKHLNALFLFKVCWVRERDQCLFFMAEENYLLYKDSRQVSRIKLGAVIMLLLV